MQLPIHPPQRRNLLLVAGVVGLHLLAVSTLSRLGVWRDRGALPAEQTPLRVWLLNGPQPAAGVRAPEAKPSPAVAAATAAATETTPSPRRVRPAQPQAITLPAQGAPLLAPSLILPMSSPMSSPISSPMSSPPSSAQTLPSTAVEAPPQPPESAPATPPPLNLSLPRGASAPWRGANPAVDDSRSRSARATFEARFARDNGGDGRWIEERLDNDRIRFRRGGVCVDMERSRAGTLDPFNNAYSAKPWVAKQPREC